MRLSITTRMVLSFLIIILVTTALFMLLTNRVIASRFADLVARSGQVFARRAVPLLERYYRVNGSWDGVADIVDNLVTFREGERDQPRQPFPNVDIPNLFLVGKDERMILLADSEVVFDTNPDGPNIANADTLRKYGVAVEVDGVQVGTVLVGSTLGFYTESQERFLREVNRTLFAASILAIFVVLVVAVLQSQSIIRPVRQLAGAASLVAKGDYSQRIAVNRKDELGEMAVAFNEMAGELAQQQGLRRQAMADIAHELRTPLSVLQIDLESLEDGLLEFTSENLHILQNEVAHLNNLVEDLRMLALVDADDLRIEKNTVEIGAVIREMIERHHSSAREAGVDLRCVLPPEEIFVTGDAQRIAQILINLISNALRHTPAGGSVIVELLQQQQRALVSVIDTGEGISVEDQLHVFDRFYRVEKSRSRDQGGSGLGLSIARSLVETQGGKIWVESEEGKGAAFKFWLPAVTQ